MQIRRWEAIYNDGNILHQYNGDGTENKYIDIDRHRLIRFILHDSYGPAIVLNLTRSKKLIYRRRVALNLNSKIQEVVYIAGWQENIEGKNIQMLCFLFEDGHIEIANHFSENHPWFYPVIFLPDECI